MQNYRGPVLLNGMGGMGKSKLMNYWVREAHDRNINNISFQNIIHIDCSVDVEIGFLKNYGLLDQLGLSHLSKDNTHNKIDIIVAALNQLKDLLLVLDDLPWQEEFLDNCADQLARLSTLPCHIIATSRSQDYDEFKQISIKSLSKNQCIDLFLTHSKVSTVEHIEKVQEIVELAGNHTLTIELLGKTAYRQQYSPEELLDLLKEKQFHIDTKVRYKKDSTSVNESIDTALRKLFSLSGLSNQQQEVLYHLSLLDSQEISFDLLIEWLGEDLIKDKSMLMELLTSGWLQVSNSNNSCYQLHQVISHAVLTEFCNTYSGDTRTNFLQPVVAQLEKYYEQFDTYRTIQEAAIDQKQRLDKAFLPSVAAYICNCVYLTHDFKRLEELTDSLNLFTEFCLQQGEYNLSWKVLKTIVDHLKYFLGDRSSSYLITINNLATLNFHLGDFNEALDLYKKIINIVENNLGENNLSYAGYLANLASLYEAMGEYKLALPLYQKISYTLGNETSEKSIDFFATSLSNLALLYNSMGKYQESLQINLKVLTILREKMNGYHPGYATSLNNLADLYEKMGDYKKSLPLYQESLKIRKEQLGDLHPDYASSLNSLADLFESMENYEESLVLYTQALEIRKKILGENHYDYATSLNNLAFIHHKMENYQQALPLYLQSLAIRENSLGEKHPEVAASLNNLADLYKEQRKFKKSLIFHNKALKIRKEKLGIYHPLYAQSLSNIACLYSEMGEFKKSIPFYLQAMVIVKKSLGYEHPFSKGIRNSYLAAKILYERK